MAINFFQEDILYNLPRKIATKHWLSQIASDEGYQIKTLNYIFCSDEYLHHINKEYLDHDTFTDIITFDNSDNKQEIEGDVFISIDRLRENAESHKNSFEEEMIRVLSHGLFHLLGYMDKTPQEKKNMRQKEDDAIRLFYKLSNHHVPRGT